MSTAQPAPFRCNRCLLELAHKDSLCPACELLPDFTLEIRDDGGVTVRDDWSDFREWLVETYPLQDRDALALEIRRDRSAVLALFRYDTGLEAERLTVAIIECSECRVLVRVDEWRGKQAHRGVAYMVSHTMCDACLAKREVAA